MCLWWPCLHFRSVEVLTDVNNWCRHSGLAIDNKIKIKPIPAYGWISNGSELNSKTKPKQNKNIKELEQNMNKFHLALLSAWHSFFPGLAFTDLSLASSHVCSQMMS